MDRSVSSSLACKGSVPDEELASLIPLEWQTRVQIHGLLCISFLWKDKWSYSLDIFYHIGLCGIARDAHRNFWVWHWKVNNQCVLHDTISLLHVVGSVSKGFSVVLGWCAGRPNQAVIPACNWSGAMQDKLFDKGEFCLLGVCIFVWSRVKQSGPFSWLY